MLNRHGLIAGATGTGKTKTLQVLAEQLSAAGVPVFAADVKGDLSGLAAPGRAEREAARAHPRHRPGLDARSPPRPSSSRSATAAPACPVRATVSGFGPLLLSKVLGLNDTQESSLGLVFHYAEQAGLPLLDLADLRSVLTYLTSDDGKAELAELGGLSKATVGVVLRELITFADQGADAFFGEPEIDTAVFLRTAADGRGIVSLLELPGVHDRPALFSTFLMWLLADLYNDLPEVGDLDRPKLVFFFDEAHLLFADASKAFLDAGHPHRAADPVEGRRHRLRHADPEGRARRRPRASSARGSSTSCAPSRPTTPRRCGPPSRPTRRATTTSGPC